MSEARPIVGPKAKATPKVRNWPEYIITDLILRPKATTPKAPVPTPKANPNESSGIVIG